MSVITEPDASITDQVRSALSDFVATGRLPSADEVAESISLSTGHMRRMLRAEGTTMVAERDELMREHAVEALRRGDSVQLTAHRLGFTDSRSFRRAFKRWTGEIPSAFLPR